MIKKNIISKFTGLLLILVVSFGFVGQAHATDNVVLGYANGIGGDGLDKGLKIKTDTSGNVYTVGLFSTTADLDPSSGTANFTSNGLADIFITKLDSSGDFVWAKQIGSTGDEWAQAINFDSLGNIYISGRFASTADFDPGAGTTELTSAGGNDNFILKLDSSGDFVWVKQFGGTGAEDSMSLLIDSNDNIHLFGNFSATVDFDPGAGTTELTSAGSVDIFILRLDSNGDFVWVKKIGSTGWGDVPRGAFIDSSDNIYLTGTFQNTVDFDPGAGTNNLIATGTLDVFILKLDSAGDFVFAKALNSSNRSYGNSIMVDNSSNVYVNATFNDTVDVDPGAGTTTLTTAGSYDIFLLKLDSSGDFVWVKQFGGTGSEWAVGVSFDSSYNIYTSGRFYSTVDFDPNAGTTELTSAGSSDSFFLKLDSSGDFVWVKQAGSTGDDESMNLYIDSSDNFYSTGYFSSTVDFDSNAGTTELTSAGNYDTFILKLIPDSTGPTFTVVSSSNLANTTATITWTTNEASSSIVEYGLTTSYGSTTTEVDTGAGVTSHSVNLTGLDSCTTYHFRVKSNDVVSNLGTGSDSTFTTPGCAAVPVYILQAMSDAIRAQENNTVVLPPTTNTTNTNTQTTNTNNTVTNTKFIFTKNLKYKMKDNQVLELQKFLNNNGYPVSTSGIGSLGNETNYFGRATQASLIKYQIANDIKPAVGYFGPVTRGVVNNLAR